MGQYKVPQDVEADDKLIGPFSFRQFIYLIVVAIGLGGMWGLFMILPPLAIIPLPVVIVFGALALPLRKDQPMEIYLAAILSYHLKPKRKFWSPDGRESLVHITVPKVVEVIRAKDLSQDEADRRFSYLANIVDSRGWSVRGVDGQVMQNSSLNESVFYEANANEDILDTTSQVAQKFGQKLEQSDSKHRQELVEKMKHGANPQPTEQQQTLVQQATDPTQYTYTPTDPYAAISAQQQYAAPQNNNTPSQQTAQVGFEPKVEYNPYPNNMNQSVIQPASTDHQSTPSYQQQQAEDEKARQEQLELERQQQAAAAERLQAEESARTAAQAQIADNVAPLDNSYEPEEQEGESTSEKELSPDIINLANNPDLSIATIAHEASRIHKKEEENNEVVISLR